MQRKTTRETEIMRNARLALGYSQQEVATLAGMHVKAYQRLEYGERDIRNASMRVGLAVCTVLGIDPVTLVFGSEFTAIAVFRTE